MSEGRYRPGDRLTDRYRLLRPLAVGGMGSVWTATNLALDLPVAIKLLHNDLTSDPHELDYLVDSLRREARAAASVPHPAVVRIHDFGMTAWNDAFMAMELLTGEPLSECMGRSSRLTAERALQIMLPVAEGLDAVHAQGIVHRDLKPGNIFLAREGQHRVQPKIVDFGIARLQCLSPHPALASDAILGTPSYMAPEQARASHDVDSRADIWSFCVILFEMLSGALPFPGRTMTSIFQSLAHDEPPSLVTSVGLDPELAAILARGLSKNPDERWPSVRWLGEALSQWLLARGVTEDITGTSLRRSFGDRDAGDGSTIQEVEIHEVEIHELLPEPESKPSSIAAEKIVEETNAVADALGEVGWETSSGVQAIPASGGAAAAHEDSEPVAPLRASRITRVGSGAQLVRRSFAASALAAVLFTPLPKVSSEGAEQWARSTSIEVAEVWTRTATTMASVWTHPEKAWEALP